MLLRLHRRLDAANITWARFWKTAHTLVHSQRQPEKSWGNLKDWLRIWYEDGLYFSFKQPRCISGNMREAKGCFVVGGMFHLVYTLRGCPWSVVEVVLDEQRLVLADVLKWASLDDQALIPLATTPPPVRRDMLMIEWR
jgi:hypothetical protein